MPTTYSAPDEGLPSLLNWTVREELAADEELEMRIFTNDILPQRGAVLASFVEATFDGYTRRVLPRSGWTEPTVDANHVAKTSRVFGPHSYTATGGIQTLYGIYLVRPMAGIVVLARRFSEPIEPVAGVAFSVSPIVTLRSESYEE